MKLKKSLSLMIAVLMLVLMICSCEKDDAQEGAYEFDFTIEEYIERFNASVGTLPELGEVEEIEYTEDSLFVQYVFEDQLCFGAYINPETRNVQKVFMWLRPDGISDRACAYKFGGYNTVLLSTMLSNEDEHEKAIETLGLDADLESGTDRLFANKDFAAYYTFDGLGYRLLIMTVDEMEVIEAEYSETEKETSSIADDITSSAA